AAARADLVHIRGLQNEGFHGVVAARIAGCKRVLLSAHGFTGDLRYHPSRLRQGIVSKLLEPLSVCLSDGVFCVAKSGSRQPVIQRYARRNFGVIHNSAPRVTKLSAGETLKLRLSLGLAPADFVAIIVGRISREKGLFTLLDVADHH